MEALDGRTASKRDQASERELSVCCPQLPEETPSVVEDKFTWDMTANNNLSWENQYKPKMRFDRLYLTPYGMDTAHPVKFELIGKDHVVGCERYPSNHWGMWAEFSIRHGKDTTV